MPQEYTMLENPELLIRCVVCISRRLQKCVGKKSSYKMTGASND